MIKLGIENIDNYKNIFENKRVGLITNHTGLDKNFKSTIDILNEKVNLVALFAPEHGIRGDLQAGEQLETYIDKETNLTVYSLYGDTRKPTKEMLENLDILCFDIQDVGARFYTYIYTMAYGMMAAKENDIEFVVLDRPNPLGGKIVEGNILDLKYRSFVGYYPLLQRHGLTVGELAKLFNEEYEINSKLHIIPMENWKREMTYFDTKLNYVLPSPNLPTIESTFSYLATCYFEGTNVSEGRGTTKPFSQFGAPWLKNKELVKKLREYNYEGVMFKETYFTPTFSKYNNEFCNGVELYVTNYEKFSPVLVGMTILKLINEMHDEFEFRGPYRKDGEPMINLLIGDNYIRENNLSIDEIKLLFDKDKETFLKTKGKYHLYE